MAKYKHRRLGWIAGKCGGIGGYSVYDNNHKMKHKLEDQFIEDSLDWELIPEPLSLKWEDLKGTETIIRFKEESELKSILKICGFTHLMLYEVFNNEIGISLFSKSYSFVGGDVVERFTVIEAADFIAENTQKQWWSLGYFPQTKSSKDYEILAAEGESITIIRCFSTGIKFKIGDMIIVDRMQKTIGNIEMINKKLFIFTEDYCISENQIKDIILLPIEPILITYDGIKVYNEYENVWYICFNNVVSSCHASELRGKENLKLIITFSTEFAAKQHLYDIEKIYSKKDIRNKDLSLSEKRAIIDRICDGSCYLEDYLIIPNNKI